MRLGPLLLACATSLTNAFAQSPGGDATNLALWNKADLGLTTSGSNVTGWTDQTGTNTFTVTGTPQKIDAGLNYNPVVRFDGSSRFTGNTSINNCTEFYAVGKIVNASGASASGALIGNSAIVGGDYVFHTQGGTLFAGNMSIYTGTNALGNSPGPGLFAVDLSETTVAGQRIMVNGLAYANTQSGDPVPYGRIPTLGSRLTENIPANSELAEVIIYTGSRAGTPRAKITSYLAAKYGLTLDQTVAQSYLASDGTTKMWDHTATSASTYNKNITVIGRDDASGLVQRQSKAQTTAGLVTVSLGTTVEATNAANANTFGADKNFLSFGDDGASGTFGTVLTGFSDLNFRVTRVWKVQEYGTVGTVALAMPETDANVVLLVSSDATFDGTDTRIATSAVTIAGVAHRMANVDLANGQYFTFAKFATAPGGVMSNLQVWLLADQTTPNIAGNLTDWQNRAPSAFDLVYAASDPARVEGDINFQPAIVFDGNDYFRTDPASGTLNFTSTFTAGEVFSMVKAASTTSVLGTPYDLGGATDSYYTHNNGFIYSDFGSSTRKAWHPSILAVAEGGGTTQAPAVDVLKYQLFNTYSAASDWASSFNGRIAYSTATNAVSFAAAAGGNYIGGISGAAWQGNMPEICLYDRKLSATERARVNSYLAAKYGLTLDQTVAQSYLASDGTTKMWDHTATSASTYNKNITVIGRDDLSGLVQRQSKAQTTAGLVTVSLGTTVEATNAANANTFGADKNFLSFGDDGASGTFGTVLTGFSDLNFRVTRVWKVQEYGTVGTVALAMPETDANVVLLVSSDATFDGTDTRIATSAITIAGVAHRMANVDLANGQYFTFAKFATAPGGVMSNLQVWLLADATTPNIAGNLTDWQNRAPSAFDLVYAASDPARVEGDINFQPAIVFDGNDYFRTDPSTGTTNFTSSYTAGEVYCVAKATTFPPGANGFPYDFGGGSVSAYPYGTNIYNDFGTTARKAWDPSTLILAEGSGTIQAPAVDVLRYQICNTYSATNDWVSSFNGRPAYTSTSSAVSFASAAEGNLIGATSGTGWQGSMPEICLYDRKLTTTERAQVNSYLGAKYGLTLDQTVAQSYITSDGTTKMWDHTATNAATYNKNITVIGRDDASGLSQKQSKSINTAGLVTVGNGNIITTTNAGNSNAFSADRSFMSFGDNNGSLTWATTGAPAGRYVMPRKWLVQEFGTVGSVKVQVPDNSSSLATKLIPAYTTVYLLTDADGNFSAGATETAMTLNGTNWEANADLTSGQYFTFATLTSPTPGGVSVDNLALWLKADANTSCSTNACALTAWNDAAPTGNVGAAFNSPTLALGTHNFNPGITFNGTNAYFDVTDGFADFSAGLSAFVVASPTSMGNHARFFDFGNGGPSNNVLFTRSFTNANLRYAAYNGTGSTILNTTSNPIVNGQDNLFAVQQGAGTGSTSIFKNGLNIFSGTTSLLQNVTRTLNYLGRSNWASGDAYYAGDMSEIILFKADISATDRQKVNSYLCTKYGLTLDQSSAQSYLASDGTTKMWDHTATNAATYNKNITVIGRDDASGLVQKQSKSVNAAGLVTVGNGNTIATTNVGNASAFSADLSFLSFGDNSGALAWTSTGAPSSRFIVARKWLVQEVGTVGSVKIQVPDNSSSLATKLAQESSGVFLLTDADGDLTTGATEIPMTLNGTNWEADVDLANGQYFTFATSTASPGGVGSSNLVLWLKADAGTNCATGGCAINSWGDAAPTGNLATGFNSLTLAQGTHNFNPGITFNGTSAYFDVTDGFADFTAGLSTFVVASPTSTGNNARFIDFGNGALSNNFILCRSSTTGKLQYTTYNGSTGGSMASSSTPITNAQDNLYAVQQVAGSNSASLFKNGLILTSGTVQPLQNITRTLNYVGRSNWGSDAYYAGDMSEIVLFKTDLGATDRQKVNSYLCAKYGLTLDQSTAQSFLASNGTTMWDHTATNASTYNKDITVIGRDDASDLKQKQSKSINSGSLVTIALGTIASTNAANNGSFANDRSFLAFGDNGGAPNSVSNDPVCFSQLPTGVVTRIQRAWKAQVTNFAQDVSVAFEESGLVAYLPVPNLRLLMDDDGTDWTNATVINGAVSASGRVVFSSLTFSAATPYFTLASVDPGTPLPIELLSFTGEAQDLRNLLEWATASEQDNDHFKIQRSSNAVDFTDIGSLPSMGNAQGVQRYAFVDRTPLPGVNYYRLRQVDHNGTTTLSNVVVLHSSIVREDDCIVRTIDPEGLFELLCPGTSGEPLEILNAVGQQVAYIRTSEDTPAEIDLRAQPPGLYLLRSSAERPELYTRLLRP